MYIYWEDLTDKEKEQAKESFLSIMEDVAVDGDEYDKKLYEELAKNEAELIAMLKEKSFIRDEDNYIFVNL